MSISWIAGFVVGLLLVALIALLLRKKLGGGDYDERQQLLRGQAYRQAFIVVLLLTVLYCVIVAVGGPVMEDGVAAAVICLIGIGVFAVECVLRDAFFTVRTKPAVYLVICAAVVVSQGLNTWSHIKDGELMNNGLLTFDVVSPVCGVIFLLLGLTIVYQVYLKGDAE